MNLVEPWSGRQREKVTAGVFLAVKPDEAAARQANSAGWDLHCENSLYGRVTDWDRLHVTLLPFRFPHSLDRFVAAVAMAMRRVSMVRFRATLDRAISFRNGDLKPLVLTGDDGVFGLHLLRDQIVHELVMTGLKFPRGERFTPHLTLLRDRRMISETPIAPISWSVREVQLIYSILETREHILLDRWDLKAPH